MKTGTVKDLFDRKAVDYTVDGKCSGCGNCCSNVLPLADAEVKRIVEDIRSEVPAAEVWKALGEKPLFGHHSGKNSKTFWGCFMKLEEEE